MARITKQMQLDSSALEPPSRDNYRCEHCMLHQQSREPFRETVVNIGNTFVVSSTPIDGDDERSHDIREYVGLNDISATYMLPVKCYPYHRRISAEQLRLCHPFIVRDIEYWKPQKLLIMGASAVAQLVGKTSVRDVIGAEMKLYDADVTVTYDVSAGLTGKPEFLQSIARHVKRMSHGLGKALPPFPGWRKK